MFLSNICKRIKQIWDEPRGPKGQQDLRAYLAAAHNINAGRDIYKTHHQAIPEAPEMGADIPAYIYPPLLAMLFVPAAAMPFSRFWRLWPRLNAFFVGYTVCILCVLLDIPVYLRWFLLIFFFWSSPYRWLIRAGQIDGLVFFLVAHTFLLFESGYYEGAAVLIALATWIKLTPGLVMLYLMLQGPLFFTAAALGYFSVIGIMQALVFPREMLYFFRSVVPTISGWKSPPPWAQSITAISSGFKTGPLLAFVMRCVLGLSLAIVMISDTSNIGQRFWGLAVCVAGMLLLPNISWNMAFIGGIIPIIALIYTVCTVPFCPLVCLCFLPILVYLAPPKHAGPGIAMFTAILVHLMLLANNVLS